MFAATARKLYLAVLLSFAGICVAFTPTPAAAQKMSDDGFQLPWFHSKAEKLARQACEDDLPECRDSVRKQIASEKMITRFAPWVALCLFFLIGAQVQRMREERRRKKQEEIARHHVRASVREQKAKDAREAERSADDDSADDGFGMSAPNKRPR